MSNAIIYSNTLITYATVLNEANNNNQEIERAIIEQLKRFSGNDFEAMKWEQDEVHKLSSRKAIFVGFKDMSKEWQHLIRLWTILESASIGKLFVTHKELSHFLRYLSLKKITLRNVGKDTFRNYKEYLDTYLSIRTNTLLQERTKNTYYDLAIRFFSLMKGHPSVASIKGIEVMENPYLSNSPSNKNKQISSWKLDITDKHFSELSVPLVYRVWYWLMRMYGSRPQDVESYPLDCVKELRQDEIATMKIYVGKQMGATNRIDIHEERPYKIELLNLKEPQQKMLYELIKEQQDIAQKLQKTVEKKGFLMTRKHICRVAFANKIATKYNVATYEHMKRYWDINISKLFKAGEKPKMKEFKHTAVSKRATWGTHTYDALRDFANHQGMGSIDSYTRPGTKDQIDMQKRIFAFTSKAPLEWMFKGESVHDIKNIMAKIMVNPYAHQLPGYGFCPDASTCGNHFECLGCDFLVPNPNLREYYFEQAKDYIKRADNLAELGKNHSADDRMAVAVKFYRLYQRTFDETLKSLENVEEINLEEVTFG